MYHSDKESICHVFVLFKITSSKVLMSLQKMSIWSVGRDVSQCLGSVLLHERNVQENSFIFLYQNWPYVCVYLY